MPLSPTHVKATLSDWSVYLGARGLCLSPLTLVAALGLGLVALASLGASDFAAVQAVNPAYEWNPIDIFIIWGWELASFLTRAAGVVFAALGSLFGIASVVLIGGGVAGVIGGKAVQHGLVARAP